MARGGKRKGAGRKPAPPGERRSEIIKFRVTVGGKAAIAAAAAAAEMDVSAWLRELFRTTRRPGATNQKGVIMELAERMMREEAGARGMDVPHVGRDAFLADLRALCKAHADVMRVLGHDPDEAYGRMTSALVREN